MIKRFIKKLIDVKSKILIKTSLDYNNKGNYEGCYNQIWIRD